MAQFINGLRVPSDGKIRHIAGFGHGDNGYDVLVTSLRSCAAPCVTYYYSECGIKKSVTVAKMHGDYYIEYGTYSTLDSLESFYNEGCSLKRVSRMNMPHTVKAYRAYRMVFHEYMGVRDEIIDAINGIECIYLGNMSRDIESLLILLGRLGFHAEMTDYNMIRIKEGICLFTDGTCYRYQK